MRPSTLLARLAWLLTLLVPLAASLALAQAAPAPSPAAAGAPHQLFLPMIANQSGGGASSDALIDAAQSRGEIDAETALIYHVYVSFGDPRLPAKFHGDPSAPSDRELVGELAARFAQLSPQAQATLEPFLIPPYHVGSWWDLRQQKAAFAGSSIGTAQLRCGQNGNSSDPPLNQWHYVDSAGGLVRVWWQARYSEDEAKARNYATAVDGFWLKLAALMHREPISDDGADIPCRGGDNRLDISLVDLTNNGETYPYDIFMHSATPSYILLRRGSNIGTLIHELMHSFQFAYDVAGSPSEYDWWREATATWAIHYVEPGLNYEQAYALAMQRVPEAPLETYSLKDDDPNRAHQYGAYLLPFFYQLRTGQPDLVRASWERFEQDTNSLSAINALLDGGFKKQWPEFTLRNINNPPVDDYKQADGLNAIAKPKINQIVSLGGQPSADFTLDGDVAHLAAHSFRFSFNDMSVRSLAFENPFVNGSYPTAQVRAIYRTVGGQYQTADWTDKQWATLCRDMRGERISELTIVISNSEWQDRSHTLKPASAPKLHATNVGCRGWTVNAEFTAVYKGPTWEKTNTVKTTAVLERYMPSNGPFQVEFYKVASGTASWTHTGHIGNCSGSGSGTYDVRNPDVEYELLVETYNVTYMPPFNTGSRKYMATAARSRRDPLETIVYKCPNSTFEENPYISMWLVTDKDGILQHAIKGDGTTIEDSLSWTDHPQVGTLTQTWKWKMTALPPE